MSFDHPQHLHRSPVPCWLPSLATSLRFICAQGLVLALLMCAVSPAGAHVLFPHDYGNGEILTFSGGTPGKDYELRVGKPGGGIVKATDALLDVTFLDHRRVKIAPRNVALDVYREFYGLTGGSGGTLMLAAVYVSGTDTLVDGTLVINTVYDPSPQFQNATFTGNQRWTTRVEAVEGETQTFSFPWVADHGGTKNWRLGNPVTYLSDLAVRCEIESELVAILPAAETHSDLATLVTSETDTAGTSGKASIRFAAPAYNFGGNNDYTVRIHNAQDPYRIGGEGDPTGCSGSALDVQITVTRPVSAPATAQVLFPNDYGSGQVLNFSGGTADGSYELRVERPGGGSVKAAEAFLDVTFLSHSQVKITPRNVAPDVYVGFHSLIGAGGLSQLPAAVYVSGTDTLVDGALAVDAVYDPSPQFQDATFTGSQLWTTRVDAVENTTGAYSFPWQAVYAGDKNWSAGNPGTTPPIRCQIGTDSVAVLPPPPTGSRTATLVTDETDATGTSGKVSIEFAAPPYNPDGNNVYTVRVLSWQDPYGIDGEGNTTGCNGSALDVWITVSQAPQAVPGSYVDGDLRLVNGAVPNEGRLEMYVDDQWGTICDDYWTDDEADVACRQLGYEQGSVRNGGRFLQSHFGAADEGVPIWLDNLLCEGDEAGLMDCPRASQPGGTDLGQHNCSLDHLEDVGVRCLTGELAEFSVADDSANEGGILHFHITLSRARESATRVDYATSDGTARAGADYVPASGTLFFYAGELTRTVTVTVLDDSHDDDGETLTLTLSNAVEARIEDGEAIGTIVNSDPLPKAWVARFGRTVAGHLVDALEARLETPTGSYVQLGGHRLGGAAEVNTSKLAPRLAPDLTRGPGPALWDESEPAQTIGQDMTVRQLLLGSAFHLVSNEEASTPYSRLTAWGRVATSGFDGGADRLSLDGTVTTATLGVDGAWRRWLTGVALAYSEGKGSFGQVEAAGGNVDSTLTSLHPYVGYTLSDRVRLWAMGGFGRGVLTLTAAGDAAMETDIGLTMAAIGSRSVLAAAANGLTVALETDAFWVHTTSDATAGLLAADADVTRLRLGLESSYAAVLKNGTMLTPRFELGLRHDGGDAETGLGVEVGGGLIWSVPARGLSVELEARSLVAHQVAGFRDWSISGLVSFDPHPSSDRGLSASLRSSIGLASLAGTDALLGRETLAELAARDASRGGRLAAEAAYGFPILGGRFTGAPWAGAGVLESGRDYRVGYRISSARLSDADMRFGIEGMRRESDGDAATEHAVNLRFAMRW